MKIISGIDKINYSKNSIRFARNGLSYFQNNKIEDIKEDNKLIKIFYRIKSSIEQIFGYKSISQLNLSICIKNAIATVGDKKEQFSYNELQQAKKMLIYIQKSKKFGSYLEKKGSRDKQRIIHLNKLLDEAINNLENIKKSFSQKVLFLQNEISRLQKEKYPIKQNITKQNDGSEVKVKTLGADEMLEIYSRISIKLLC